MAALTQTQAPPRKERKAFGGSKIFRKKGGTASTQKHRFESFSERIAKLNIDSVRREQSRNAAELTDRSHFRSTFEDWRDRNLSRTFTDFARRVDPLSENLPQIVHNQGQIVKVLHESIQEADALALEALLDLIAKLAHDVGARFEEHFQETVRIVSDLASKHGDVAVVEWSFACLAWLFKYLARLLVPDLRPLYDLMAPLLGKELQKDFVTRFAAEAMSFLIRKAAANHHKGRKALESIVEHAFQDLNQVAGSRRTQYQQGLSVLFSESIKGIRRGVASGAAVIVQAMLDCLFAITKRATSNRDEQVVVQSVLINTIHHTNAEGFMPVMQTCFRTFEENLNETGSILTSLRITYVLLGTRKGSRVIEWPSVLDFITRAMESLERAMTVLESSHVAMCLANATLALQYAPLEHVSSFSQTIIALFEKGVWDTHFLSLCNMMADVGRERYDSLFARSLQKFVIAKWEENETSLLYLLPKLGRSASSSQERTKLPQAWQEKIHTTFSTLEEKDACPLDNIGTYIDLLNVSHSSKSFDEAIAQDMVRTIEHIGLQEPRELTLRAKIMLTKGLSFLVTKATREALPHTKRSLILSMAPGLAREPEYLRGIHHLLNRFGLEGCHPNVFEDVSLTQSLIDNLASPSHELRSSTIQVIFDLYHAKRLDIPDLLRLAQTLEDSTFSVENLRAASMEIRKLASTFISTSPDSICERAAPAYCFGLFHVRLTPLWTDACKALQAMASTPGVEDAIVERAIAWLDPPTAPQGVPMATEEMTANEATNDLQHELPGFQCVNLSRVDRTIEKSLAQIRGAKEVSIEHTRGDTVRYDASLETNRSRSLLLFRHMPELAEKRSRFIVPILLDWAFGEDEVISPDDEQEDGADIMTYTDGNLRTGGRLPWSRKDRKSMLSLFAEFVNPAVLYRSQEVFEALLALLRNGDAEIQRSALKALFKWRAPHIKPYEQNLMNLLDDSRFREELTVFLDDEDTNSIRMEHRAGLMPILLRLLYGRVVTRSGIGGSRGTQEARRKAVLSSLARFENETVAAFVDIALAPFNHTTSFEDLSDFVQTREQTLNISPRKQSGTMKMLHEMLESFSTKMEPIANRLVVAVMLCLVASSKRLASVNASGLLEHSSLWKSVRHEALACIDALFGNLANATWIDNIKELLFTEVISDRLVNLPIETAQAPSILLKLFSTWASSAHTVDLLWDPVPSLLEHVADCLTVASAKDNVRVFVLRDIVGKLISRAQDDSTALVARRLQEGFASVLLKRITICLEQQTSKDCQEEAIQTIINLQPYVVGAEGTKSLLHISLKMLSEPSRKVNPKLKGEILLLLGRFLPQFDFAKDATFHRSAVSSISKLFGYFRDIPNRTRVVTVFDELTKGDVSLSYAADICRLLNAPSSARLDQPDFEARASGFEKLSILVEQTDDPAVWEPLLNNLMFFVHDDEELSTRSNASLAIRRLIQRAVSIPGGSDVYRELIDGTIVPATQKGMRDPSELIRSEYVAILAELVKADWRSFGDMTCLLGVDEETSFFNNILHLQQHRRVRALRRLSIEAVNVSATNLSRLCIPLIENFLKDVDETNQNLANETIQALKTVVLSLEWPRYRALLQRFMQDTATFSSKLGIRTLASVVDGLYVSHCDETEMDSTPDRSPKSSLRETLPSREALSNSLKESVLTKLLNQIHYQDETSIDIRILLAVNAVKLILVLPEAEIHTRLPAVLIDVCNILKSKAQEARDSARKTLVEISAIIGPRYFGFVLKQLKTALKRGSQLHVLSYTLHSIMVATTPKYPLGSLDYCLPEIVNVIMDDTLGVVGQEKEAPGYINSMKEFKKKSIGFDTMELLASISSLAEISHILRPIQSHLEKLKPNMAKVDELLRRTREGLRRNEAANSQEMLILCFEILKEAASKIDTPDRSQLQGNKITAFAFELLRRILDKYEELKNSTNLEGFVDMLQVALKSDNDEVLMATMRFLGSIIKVPLKGLDEQAGSYIRLATRTIESASSVNTPNAQAAFRLVSALLRERPAAVIKQSQFETNAAFLLTKIKPDLEEPSSSGDREYQVTAFNFLKAVMSRGVLVKEIYEVMDVVREVMITSQSPPIPDLARSVFARFVLDYFPEEGKGLSKQLQFLISNLQYEHHRGRQSVMEVMMFVLNKRPQDSVQSILVSFFLPLMLVLIVDENEDCRRNAVSLLRSIFVRADKERNRSFAAQMTNWLDSSEDHLWRTAALNVWPIYLEIHPGSQEHAVTVYKAASGVLLDQSGLEQVPVALIRAALDGLHKLCSLYPDVAFRGPTNRTWDAVTSLIESENGTIAFEAARLIRSYLAHCAKSIIGHQLPLTGSWGLECTAPALESIAASSMAILQSPASSSLPEFVDLTVQNVISIVRLHSDTTTDTISSTISSALRRELSPTAPPYSKLAALKLLAALLSHVDISSFDAQMQSLLIPLHHLTSPAVASTTTMSTHPDFATTTAAVHVLAQEVMATMQEKLGPERYIREMQMVQRTVRERREERRGKRALETVSEPEKAERERKRRMVAKKGARKRKGEVRAGMRRGW